MNPAQTPNLNADNGDNFYAESSKDLKEGLTATEISMTTEEIDRIFNKRFSDAANDNFFDVKDSAGATNLVHNSTVTTALMSE